MCKETILTIAIPTYNRAGYLGKQLDRLKKQNYERIEMLVCDNGSSDNTAEIVKQYQKDMPNLIYSRNTENIGFDRNVMKLYCLAQSKYIWFVSDDDAILDGAVCNVLEFVATYQPTVAVLGTADTAHEVSRWKMGNRSVETFESLEDVPDYSLFTRIIFISTLIVQKQSKISEAILEQLVGSNFFQLSLSLISLSHRFRLCLSPGLVVVCREPGYVTRTEIAQLWFCGPFRAMDLPEYGYKTEKVRLSISKGWKPFIVLLLCAKVGMYRINPTLSRETAHQLRTLLGIRILLFVLLCLKTYQFTPSWLLRPFYWLRCVVRYGLKQGSERFRMITRQALSAKDSGF